MIKNFIKYIEQKEKESCVIGWKYEKLSKEKKLDELLFYYYECCMESNREADILCIDKQEFNKHNRYINEINNNIQDIKNKILNLS